MGARLDSTVAQRIVDRALEVIGHDLNVMDAAGRIIASSRTERVGQVHEGAVLAASQDRAVAIAPGEEETLRGVRPGVNLPLRHRGELVGVIGVSGPPEEVRVLTDLIKVTAELILDQARVWEHGAWRDREVEEYVVAVATGAVAAGDAGTAWGRELGLRLERRWVCTLVTAADAAGDSAGIHEVHRVLLRAVPEVLVGRTAPGELAVWWTPGPTGAAPPAVTEALMAGGSRVRSARGTPHDGVAGLRPAWLTARDAAAVRSLADRLPADLVAADDLAVLAMLRDLADHPRAAEIAEPWRRLADYDTYGDLRATVYAWLSHDRSPSATAAALTIHRSTLRYRIDRIAALTHLDLQRFPDVVRLYLALVVTHAREAGG